MKKQINSEKLTEQIEERKRLYNIVCILSGHDIKKYSRYRPLVYARMVYANILLDEGHEMEDIAHSVGHDRTNVYHYKKSFPNLMEQSKYVNELYRKSRQEFYKVFSKEVVKDDSQEIIAVKSELISLRKKYESALREINNLKESKDDIDVDRFYDTFKAITQNVKKGREELLSKKIHNTINTVNSSLTY